MQIIVIGMHRSGTSLAAQVLNQLGAYVGTEKDLLPASKANKRGYLERIDVVDLNDFAFEALGCNWFETSNFDLDLLKEEARTRFKSEAAGIISHLNTQQDWLIKDPRMCLTLPLWTPLLERAAFIIVYRNPASVALSLHKRDMFPVFFSAALWEKYNVNALNWTSGLPRIFISFEELASDPLKGTKEMMEKLSVFGANGLRLPSEDAVSAWVDKGLISSDMTDRGLQSMSVSQKVLWDYLEEGVENDDREFLVSPVSEEILSYYESVYEYERVYRSRSKCFDRLVKLVLEKGKDPSMPSRLPKRPEKPKYRD